jgi:hypothetical protein
MTNPSKLDWLCRLCCLVSGFAYWRADFAFQGGNVDADYHMWIVHGVLDLWAQPAERSPKMAAARFFISEGSIMAMFCIIAALFASFSMLLAMVARRRSSGSNVSAACAGISVVILLLSQHLWEQSAVFRSL